MTDARVTTVAQVGREDGDVYETLNELRRTEHGSFAVFQLRDCPDVGVQFAGSADEPLLFDMPVQVMSSIQIMRMTRLARFFQVSTPDFEAMMSAPGAERVMSFQRDYDNDAATAARLVGAVFSQVFECPSEATIECHLIKPEARHFEEAAQKDEPVTG